MLNPISLSLFYPTILCCHNYSIYLPYTNYHILYYIILYYIILYYIILYYIILYYIVVALSCHPITINPKPKLSYCGASP
jgi:hypothetical protein